MANRRDFLKILGVGSVVAPMGLGIDKPVRLIEPAKVELFQPGDEISGDARLLNLFQNQRLFGVQVLFRESNGSHIIFEADSFITHMSPTYITTTSYELPTIHSAYSLDASWELKGRVVASWTERKL